MLGTNDSAKLGKAGTFSTADDYRANLKAIVDTILTQHPDAKIFLQRDLLLAEHEEGRF
jgi:alpha-beta hydrolase superfamily lysophospholipase